MSGPDKTRPHEGREIAAEAMSDAAKRARLAATRNIPAPPSPAYMLRAGADAERKISFLSEMCVLFDDAYRLRAAGYDEETGRITDHGVFSSSMKLRLQIINQGIAVRQEVYSQEEQQKFFDILSDVMVNLLVDVPDVQARVIRRLCGPGMSWCGSILKIDGVLVALLD